MITSGGFRSGGGILLKSILLTSIVSLLGTKLRVASALLGLLVLIAVEAAYFGLVRHHTPGRALGIFGTLGTVGQVVYFVGMVVRGTGSLKPPFATRR